MTAPIEPLRQSAASGIMLSIYILLFAVLYLVFRRALHTWQARQAYQCARERYGCEPPRKYRHTLPFGYDLWQLRKAAVADGRYNDLYKEHFDIYGSTFADHALGVATINTTEIANRHAVFTSNYRDYSQPVVRQKAIEPLLGVGILFKDWDRWKVSRELVVPLFARAEISDVKRFDKHVTRLMSQIPEDGSTVDLQDLLKKLFLDSSIEFIFGGDPVRTLDAKPQPEGEEFLVAFDQALAGAGRRGNLAGGGLPWLFLLDSAWDETCKKVHKFVDRRIARALAEAEKAEEPSSGSSRSGNYVLLDEMAKVIKDPTALRSEILNVFFPSRDTSSIALSNTIFHLARKPSLWAELRRLALSVGDLPMTADSLRSLDLIRYALFEGIRLQGPSGIFTREALRDTILPCGGGKDGKSPIFVPRGTVIALNNYPVHRDPAVWGPDVDEFRPARFIGRENEFITQGFFRPFLEGPRTCPARQQVLAQAVYLLVRILREFERIENRDPCLEYVEEIKMLCESRNGVKIALYRSA